MLDHESVRVVRNFVQRTSDRINERYGGLIDRIRRIFVVELAIRVARGDVGGRPYAHGGRAWRTTRCSRYSR